MDSVEALTNRWQLIFQTLESGTRRQLVGQSEEMPEHLLEGCYFHDNSSVIS